MGETPRSRRRSTAFALLTIGAVSSGVALLCAAFTAGAVPAYVTPEGALLPTLLLYLFAFTWWLTGLLLLIGALLGIGVGEPRPLLVLAVIGVASFVATIGILIQSDLFLWPFTAEFR